MKKVFRLHPQRVAVLIAATLIIIFHQASSSFAQAPSVQVDDNSESPLRISLLKVEQGDSLLIHLMVRNAGDKPISTYAVRHDDVVGDKNTGGLILSDSPTQGLTLQPGESRETIIGASSKEAQQIKLSVDFVEFLDGKTWGPDTYKSGEQLEGQRAGAQAVSNYLLGMLQKDGEIAVVQAIASQSVEIQTPKDQSPKWSTGFYLGVKAMRDRLFYLNRDQGLSSNLESVLKTPFDAVSEFGVQKSKPTPETAR